MKIYIAGKIAGDRRYRAKFREAAKALEAVGHVVLNPATLPDGLTDADYMRICMAMVDTADLFGRWVPTSWIVEVLDACQRAPQHRYLFLTKNPARYLELDHMALLPHAENFWYGSTVANEDAAAMYTMQGVAINSFWSMEPLLGPVDMSAAEGLPQWVILGAETGSRPDKVTPRREWVDQIAEFCAENEIPVFYKDNLRAHFPDLPPSASPWDDREDETTEWAAHYMRRFERQV